MIYARSSSPGKTRQTVGEKLTYKVMFVDCHTCEFVVATSQESLIPSSFLRNIRREVSPKVSSVATTYMVYGSSVVTINFNEPNDTTGGKALTYPHACCNQWILTCELILFFAITCYESYNVRVERREEE